LGLVSATVVSDSYRHEERRAQGHRRRIILPGRDRVRFNDVTARNRYGLDPNGRTELKVAALLAANRSANKNAGSQRPLFGMCGRLMSCAGCVVSSMGAVGLARMMAYGKDGSGSGVVRSRWR
jgi:hypothetical protein